MERSIEHACLRRSTRIGAPKIERLDELQTKVRAIWAAVLKAEPETIGLKSNFFHLGGHSLLVALACSRLGAMYRRGDTAQGALRASDFGGLLRARPRPAGRYIHTRAGRGHGCGCGSRR